MKEEKKEKRPPKLKLDYFPLATDINEDDKVVLLENYCGLEGFAVLIKLYIRIYSDKGYYTKIGAKEESLLAEQMHLSVIRFQEILACCFEFRLFDWNLWKTHNILTSKGIQERFLFATKMRKNIKIKPEYSLLNEEEKSVNVENYVENSVKNVENYVENFWQSVENSANCGKNVENSVENVENYVENSQKADFMSTKEKKRNRFKIKDKRAEADFDEFLGNSVVHPLLSVLVENEYLSLNTKPKQIERFSKLFNELEKEFDPELIHAAVIYITRYVKRNQVKVGSKYSYLKTALYENLQVLSTKSKKPMSFEEMLKELKHLNEQ